MKVEIIEQKKIPLLGRTELKGKIKYTGTTPDKDKVAAEIGKSTKTDMNLIEIIKITPIFGDSSAKVFAYVYDSEKKKEDFQPKIGKKLKEKLQKIAEKKKEAKSSKKEKKGSSEKKEEKSEDSAHDNKAEDNEKKDKPEEKSEDKKDEKSAQDKKDEKKSDSE